MIEFSLTWKQRFLRLAIEVSSWSKDPKGGVGAVLVDQRKRVIGLGFNGFPDRIADREDLLTDKAAKLPRMIHAEMNAVLNATRSVQGAAMFTTLTPCAECASERAWPAKQPLPRTTAAATGAAGAGVAAIPRGSALEFSIWGA